MLRFKMRVGKTEAAVAVLGPDDTLRYRVPSWSLHPVQSKQDAEKNPALTRGLREVFRGLGVHKVYAPAVSWANAQIVDSRTLSEKIPLGADVVLHRNRSVRADGVFIGTGKAAAMCVAGCPCIIASAGEQMLAAHAGRDSLIDSDAVRGIKGRKNLSVVHSIIEAFLERGASIDEIAMCLLFSIPTEVFEHKFEGSGGDYNKMLAMFVSHKWPLGVIHGRDRVFLNLETIFLAQAREAGIRDGYAWTAHPLSTYPTLAHTRDGHPDAVHRRNLIVVKRNQAAE